MGADNGVYILQTMRDTVDENGWIEKCTPYPVWRVAHVQAIDNFYFYEEEELYNLGAYMKEIWGHSPVFTEKKEALSFAHKVKEAVGHVEYGVSFIETNYRFFLDA